MLACAITGRVVGTDAKLETNFIYDEGRPYEVRLQNVTGDDITFSRELLSQAFHQPSVGTGWIRFHIAADRFMIRFGYDIASAYLSYPLAEVAKFHKQMYDVVPWGSESKFIDIDALLEAFNEDKI